MRPPRSRGVPEVVGCGSPRDGRESPAQLLELALLRVELGLGFCVPPALPQLARECLGSGERAGRAQTIAEALELTALVARKQPHRYGRFAARWLCLWLEEHEKATLEGVTLLVSNLRALMTSEHAGALAVLRQAASRTESS
jgi:hypothetical protein